MADNVTTVWRVYEAFVKGDISVLLGILDDKVEWHEAEHTWQFARATGVMPVEVSQTR